MRSKYSKHPGMTERTLEGRTIAVLLRLAKTVVKSKVGTKGTSRIRRVHRELLGHWRQWSVEKKEMLSDRVAWLSQSRPLARISGYSMLLAMPSANSEMQAHLDHLDYIPRCDVGTTSFMPGSLTLLSTPTVQWFPQA
jgi:hypothetical protein